MEQIQYERLSPGRKRLVRQMQEINFGRIERLGIKEGDPLFDPPPKIVREVKFGGDNGVRPEASTEDFVLKAQVVDLFRQFDGISTGQIDLIEVKHGLPFRMQVAA